MGIIQRELRLDKNQYNIKHLQMVNTILNADLTDKEIEVLAVFMSLDKMITEDDMFNTIARKKVMDKLNLSPGGLGNHLRSMIDKNALDKNEISKRIRIKPFLFPDKKVQGYQIKIVDNEQ